MNARIVKIFFICSVLIFCGSAQAQKLSSVPNKISFMVSVTDDHDKNVAGLKPGDFQISIANRAAEIASFDDLKDAPATIVFLIDLSGSQTESVTPVVKQIRQFVKNATANNEYVLIAFNKNVELITDKTENKTLLEKGLDKVLETPSAGNTAFYKAVYAGIERAQSEKYQKRVLIACSDGTNNTLGSPKLSDVTDVLKKSGVLFYSMSFKGEDGVNLFTPTGGNGREILYKFSDLSGGFASFPKDFTEMTEFFDRIAAELKSLYLITVRLDDNLKNSDKQRKIKIKIVSAPVGDKKSNFKIKTRNVFYPASLK